MKVRTYAQQKAGLTRAQKKGYEAVLLECRRTVTEWESQAWADAHRVRRGAWPDDWSRWQRALDDASPQIVGPQLDDLERIEA
jgi:hypothetical protein